MKPIIFLDFDGVLNTVKTWGKFPREEAIDPDKVERVHDLCKEFHAEIVVSSAWRTIHTINELRTKLQKRGSLDPSLVIDFTPDWKGPFSERGQEIKEWLNTHKRQKDPFIILDDLYSGAFKGLESHHVQTTLQSGFTPEKYEEARTLLRTQCDKS